MSPDLPCTSEEDEESEYSPEEIQTLREEARDPDPKVRSEAISELMNYGPCSWEDIDEWILDQDKDVRFEVIDGIDYLGAASELCKADPDRCLQVLSASAKRYGDMTIGRILHSLSKESEEWLERTWQTAESLFADALERLPSEESLDLLTTLHVAFFEDVIDERGWGPDDPHIKPWFQQDDYDHKVLLYNIARYLGLERARMRDIVVALSKDTDKEIAEIARELLESSSKAKKRKR